ncbi:glycosyltransferase family protein [Arthrobacter pigmenti]
MKILHVTDASSAGVLSAVTTLAREQAADPGFSDVVFAYVPRPDSPPKAEIQRLLGDRASLQEWSTSHDWRRLTDLVAHLTLAMRSRRYDVVHLHSSRAGFLGRLVAVTTGCRNQTVYSPHCFSFAQTGLAPVQRSLYLALERAGSRWGSRLMLVSDSEYAVTRLVLPKARAAVLANAIDHSLLEPRAVEAAPKTGPLRVVHIGRIAPQKAPDVFTETVRRLQHLLAEAGRPPIEVEWLGDGNRSLLDDPGIHISGWLPQPQLRARLSAADLVLFTSRGEGMPMALLEAQGLGIPVVASRVVGVVDIVEHGQTGYLANSAAGLAEAAFGLISDDGSRVQMGAAARERGRNRFDVRLLGRDSLNAYASLELAGGAGRRRWRAGR